MFCGEGDTIVTSFGEFKSINQCPENLKGPPPVEKENKVPF